MSSSTIELPASTRLCGYRTCDEFRTNCRFARPDHRCIHLSENRLRKTHRSLRRRIHLCRTEFIPFENPVAVGPSVDAVRACVGCGSAATGRAAVRGRARNYREKKKRKTALGGFRFYWSTFPRSRVRGRSSCRTIRPSPASSTLGGDIISAALACRAGCPHHALRRGTQVDVRTGVIVWCVTGPLDRAEGFQGSRLLHRRSYRPVRDNARN